MLSTKLFYKFFCAVTVVAFMFQLMNPTTVYADGEDATPEPAPTSIPVDEATPAPSELVIPEGTDLIVLDENGQPLPLATQAAADVIVSGDPIWCPDTVDTPTSGFYGCSTNDGTLQTALTFASQQAADGTIWIQATPEDKSYIYNEYVGNTHALTLQGGWGGAPNKTVSGVSTFTVPISIGWGGQLTINNLTIDGSAYAPVWQMLEITSTADDPSSTTSAVTMNNVTVTGSKVEDGKGYGNGAKIVADGSVEVSGSNFDDNYGLGLKITAKNNITLNDVTANNSAHGIGAYLSADGGDNTISNSSFNNNNGGGLSLSGHWGLSEDGILPTFKLTNVTADHNTGNGLRDSFTSGSVNILICSGSYSDNTGYGINIYTRDGTTTFGGTVVSTGNGEAGQNSINPEAALGGDCVEVSLDGGERTKAKPAQKGYENSSEAVNSQEKTFDCDSYLGLVIYTEELKDEDHVAIPCGSKGSGTRASAFKTMESDLPGKPSVGTFVSALKLAIEDNENAAAIHTGPMMVSFKLPEGANPSDYSLMFWNGTAWELVPNIFSADGYFQSWVNMLGYYMLIKN